MEAREDELLALTSILSPLELQIEDKSSGKLLISPDGCSAEQRIKLSCHDSVSYVNFLPSLSLSFQLTDNYPMTECLKYSLACDWLDESRVNLLSQQLLDLFTPGEVVLFDWYDSIKTFLNDFLASNEEVEVLNEAQLEKIVAFNESKCKNVIDSCGICTEVAKLTKLSNCAHFFCKSCLSQHCTTTIQDGLSAVACPDFSCDQQILLRDIEFLVEPQLFEKYDSKLLDVAIMRLENVSWCPRQSCQHPAELFHQEMLGVCPACGFAFCLKCSRGYHGLANCSNEDPGETSGEEDPEEAAGPPDPATFALARKMYTSNFESLAKQIDIIVDPIFSFLAGDQKKASKFALGFLKGSEEYKDILGEQYGGISYCYYYAKKTLGHPIYDCVEQFSFHAFRQVRREQNQHNVEVMADLKVAKQSKTIQPCPRCFVLIEKNEGCSHMFCTWCNYDYCWDCMGPYGNCECIRNITWD